MTDGEGSPTRSGSAGLPTWLWVGAVFLALAVIGGAVVAGEWRNPGSGSESHVSIPLDEFPAGLGRGYPAASLVGLDNGQSGLARGDQAPDFRLVLDDGRSLSLSDLRGRPVMLNFWATWCGPCRLEMPDIVERAVEAEDLVVLAINVQEDLAPIQAFSREFGMAMPVVQDREGLLRKLYGVRGMPTSVFINRDGEIVDTWSGLLTPDLLDKMLAGSS
ncbi:MAG: TlpA family protein disulfide reductase [Caldilineaceae bacterium]|nr:TlpA family protein disulfide reductase [Caldilineaceae bacterium]